MVAAAPEALQATPRPCGSPAALRPCDPKRLLPASAPAPAPARAPAPAPAMIGRALPPEPPLPEPPLPEPPPAWPPPPPCPPPPPRPPPRQCAPGCAPPRRAAPGPARRAVRLAPHGRDGRLRKQSNLCCRRGWPALPVR
ncbi:hypothetical protein ZWY2020_043666 [Hordeum vulgare]|nr:hypothetical protein ZWY2020_043666 [Hordeum vulgare]